MCILEAKRGSNEASGAEKVQSLRVQKDRRDQGFKGYQTSA